MVDKPPVKIGLLGCGTVGGGVLRLLQQKESAWVARVGAPLEVTRVVVRDLEKGRVPECRPEWLTTDYEKLFGSDVDLIVEVMGGEEPAKGLILRALGAGKSVVTANKLLIAKHGPMLLNTAISQGVDLAFEASVGGGIPIIRTLREALASDSVQTLHAILNGTSNYILTRMRDDRMSFDAALAEAQARGYAEADPTLDVDGHDAAQKLVVASLLAFGAEVAEEAVSVEGIRGISQIDFRAAERFGYAIKHLAIAHELGHSVRLRAHPALVPKHSVLASIDGVLNGVLITGEALGPCFLVGRGAGDMPTAVSVVSDILDLARSLREGEPGRQTRAIQFKKRPLASLDDLTTRYYLRFDVADRPGVLSFIAGALGEQGVSIEQMFQQGQAGDTEDAVHVVLVTHTCRESAVQKAIVAIQNGPFLKSPPRLIRVEG
ncbi:MAG: homoserine dehydrogenase [Polyangiaceae bacterium]|nr:homoserine dehydrogenase [Polyangiaceae bacterium]